MSQLVVGSHPEKLDAGCLADHAASSVAADQIPGAERRPIGELDVDAGVVLRETRHFAPTIDRHPQLADPGGQYALDVVLPQAEPVVVARGKVADVQHDRVKAHDLRHLALGEEPIRDAALIENLDRARVQATHTRADEVLTGTSLDDYILEAADRIRAMPADTVIVALSGGVDSAVAALLLRDAGYSVECLHMTAWEDDGYCEAAADFQDARRVCAELGLPLHRVNFAREYRERVFAHFLRETAAGRTPNPDVLCNREIKFGIMRRYARRLGGLRLATGHYARLAASAAGPALFKGVDPGKDQSYFLHAVDADDLEDVLFPLGELHKSEVRAIAARAGLEIARKKDSTGICFVGERPFAEFLSRYLSAEPGDIKDAGGAVLGRHRGLPFYTLGQRQGLRIGGVAAHADEPWYVAEKRLESNELVVVQGGRHPLLYSEALLGRDLHWIGEPPPAWAAGSACRCAAKTRYRQPDQPCTLLAAGEDCVEVAFDEPQRAVTPGQHVVFYAGDRCLGGAVIERSVEKSEYASGKGL